MFVGVFSTYRQASPPRKNLSVIGARYQHFDFHSCRRRPFMVITFAAGKSVQVVAVIVQATFANDARKMSNSLWAQNSIRIGAAHPAYKCHPTA